MKIMHLIGGGDVGGAKTHVLGLLKGLGEHCDVTLVSFREGGFSDEAREYGINTVVMPSNPLKCLRPLRKLYREGCFDIVHSHGARGNMMAVLLKWLDGASVVTTVHSDPKLDYLGRPLAAMTFGLINRFAQRRIKYRIAVSDPVADMLISRGFSPYNLFPIYNGVNFNVEERVFDRAAWLAEHGLTVSDGDVVCGMAARLNPVKDIPTLLRAFSKTPPNAKLIIAGSDDGAGLENLQSLSRELGIAERVCFAGWVDDMDGFYRAIDVNCLTSLYETFPYALTDGTRMKCATVASRVGGVPILIDHGVNGFMFEAGDADALAGYLNRLIDNEPLREALGNALHDKAKREFSLDATVTRQVEIYRRIARCVTFRKNDRMGVTICGAYGKNNSGDDAILEAIIGEVRSIDSDLRISVLSRSPKATRASYRADSLYTFNIFAIIRAMRSSRLYINGGGSLIQDVTSTRSILFYLFTLKLGKLLGCKVMMYGCGIGPVNKPQNRRRAASVLNTCVDAITLREDGSMDELKSLGVTAPNIVLAADPALILEPSDSAAADAVLVSAGAQSDTEYICFALRRWKNFSDKARDIAKAVDDAYNTHGLTALFLPVENRDNEAAREVAALMRTPYVILPDITDAKTVIAIMGKMKCVVAMRLHALIFAAGRGVPLVGIAYDPKVSAFLRYMEKPLCVELGDVTAEKLSTLVGQAVSGQDEDAAMQSVERLKAVEARNFEVAARLIGGNL